MNAKTAKLINKFAAATKRSPRAVKRLWRVTPIALRGELRASMRAELQ